MKNKKRSITNNKPQLLALFIIFNFLFNQLAFAQEATRDTKIDKIKLQAVLTPPYVIGPGDQLTIIDRTLREVFGQVEQYNVVVSADGYISIPLPDGTQESLLVAGSTLTDLSSEVRKLFGKTLRNPLVYVQISGYRPINVYIGGEVVKPGVYKIDTASTTEEGGTTTALNTFGLSITQAIQLAGGLKPRANVKAITVTRGGNLEKKFLDLTKLLTGEDVSQDINLQPGDTIYVTAAKNIEDQAQYHLSVLGKLAYQDVPVNVVGQVRGPGSYTLPNDATLVDALGHAGGLNDVGTLKKLKLSRYDKDGIYKTQDIDLHDLILKGVAFDQISLRPNDKIEFVTSRGKATRRFFSQIASNTIATVLGAAAQNFGQFVVQDNLFDRITRAGRLPVSPGQGRGDNQILIFGD